MVNLNEREREETKEGRLACVHEDDDNDDDTLATLSPTDVMTAGESLPWTRLVHHHDVVVVLLPVLVG